MISVTAVDPVCGMTVDVGAAAGTANHGETTYYFCNPRCRDKFQADPERYLAAPGQAGMAHAEDSGASQYTCPMHPEVVQDGPGTCPLCGMALEPMTFDPNAEENDPELRNMTVRLIIAAICTAPVLFLAMTPMIPGVELPHWLARWGHAIELVLATPVLWWCGWPFFVRAVQALRHGAANMFTLIAIGSAAAWIISVIAVLAPNLFPASFRNGHGQVPVYFEASAVIVTLVLVGQVLELRARRQTGSAIRALIGLSPQTARRIAADGTETDIPLDRVHVGDRLRVRPGEKLPVDGEIVEGTSAVDESAITGEAMPVAKKPGDQAIGGTMNTRGSFVMKATRVGRDTLLARIVARVAEAQRSRAPIQKLADRVASWFVPAVVLAAILTFAMWATFGPSPALAYAFVNAVAVLIIACPCALGLATPMSIMVGVGRGAREGILFKDAEALQVMGKVDTVVVDKTGTLTEGKPRLVTVEPVVGIAADELLNLAAAAERGSEHPLAAAIVAAAVERPEAREQTIVNGKEVVSGFESIPGKGVLARVNGRAIVIGNGALLTDAGMPLGELEARADALQAQGQTVVFVAVDGKLAGLLGVADPIKASTVEAVAQLHADGLSIAMLTGDNRATAEAVAQQLRIDIVMAEVLPEQKGDAVRRMQGEGRIVAMAGDGINDAPALALANVGIAMGTGTDVAVESAGITLVKGDLRGIAKARRLSRAAMRNIRQNLFFAFAYNAIGVPVAAGVLYPFFGVLLSPMIAAAAMSLSSVSVIANALRLRGTRI
ncbi:MAG TPA: heavy metal translocating P-type ATPase [Gemmataceae bacterium]